MRRPVAGACATGLLALAVPFGAAAPAGAEPGYVGHTSEAWASPVRLEIYEPTIPIPTEPQVELNLAFSRVRGQTGQLAGTASWMWPGDSVGTGFKTFVEQLGLPPELGEDGYPVQVNAVDPSGPEKQAQEPFPGTKMRASATPEEARASTGFSTGEEITEGAAGDGDGDGDGEGDGGGAPGLLGLPAIPGAPELPGLGAGGLEGLPLVGSALSGKASTTAADPSAPGLPPELALLVDAGAVSSTSRTTLGDEVVTLARSAVADVSIAGGLVTIDGVSAQARTSGDGAGSTSRGAVHVTGLRVAGQLVSIGPDGLETAGRGGAIPGLSDDPAEALEQLGISITMPPVEKSKSGVEGRASASALRIEIDGVKLKGLLSVVPLGTIIEALPKEAAELKNALDTINNLAPRIVLTLGAAESSTLTVPALDLPPNGPGGDPAPGGDEPGEAPAASGGGGGAGSGGAGDAGLDPGAPVSDDAAGGGATDAGALPDNRLTSAGLPPLTTIPGLLTWGGIALGAAAGFWLRRMGLLVLAGGAACAHGFETGLPDLRKA